MRKSKESKKMMNILWFSLAFIVMTVLMTVSSYIAADQIIKDLDKALASPTNKLIYIGRPTCSYCQQIDPILTALEDEYGFDHFYLNTDKITAKQLDAALVKLGIDKNNYGTPYFVIAKDGKKIDELIGFVYEKGLFDFLQKNSIIESDAKLAFNYVDYNSFNNLYKSSTAQVAVIGQNFCGYCTQAHPILKQIIKEENITINYLNTSYLTETENNNLNAGLKAANFNDNWGTPLMLIIKDGKVVDSINGVTTKKAYVDFLKENNIIE